MAKLPTIRPARMDDLELIQQVERDAGAKFRGIRFDDIADDDPTETGTLEAAALAEMLWVAEDTVGHPIGFAMCEIRDHRLYLREVSVSPAHERKGVGRALIQETWAHTAKLGLSEVTLSTFRDVPWNGPYYQRLGYREVSADELGPEHAAVREEERAAGLDTSLRILMARGI
jgi:predicted N-acetyltransferase YhbS